MNIVLQIFYFMIALYFNEVLIENWMSYVGVFLALSLASFAAALYVRSIEWGHFWIAFSIVFLTNPIGMYTYVGIAYMFKQMFMVA